MTVVVVSGGFDPLHSGHLEYFKAAKKLGDKLVVGVNSDKWLSRKKGKNFLPVEERIALIKELKIVDMTTTFDDSDGTAFGLLNDILIEYDREKIIFANGGDRQYDNIPEITRFSNEKRIAFVFSVGGDFKKNSSSKILKEYYRPEVIRPWGNFVILSEGPGYLVKELLINPKGIMSMQRHKHRSEHWVIVEGKININTINVSSDFALDRVLKSGQSTYIPKGKWHQIENTSDTTPAKIIETWIGDVLDEDDIIRR